MRASELATQVGGELFVPEGLQDRDPDIKGVAPIETAQAGDATFFNNAAYASFLATTKASLLIAATRQPDCQSAQIIHGNAYWAFAKIAQKFHTPPRPEAGVSPQAYVQEGAQVDAQATVMAGAFVGDGAKVGPRTVIYPHVYIHAGVEVGADCVLHASVVLHEKTKIGDRVIIFGGASIGADGFGFAPGSDGLAKIPQVGGVLIGDDVEIGANTTIDCGAMADTVIGRGSKLDSHVHIAHNVQIGEHSMVCGMSAIAGSAKLGNRVIVGGHSCVNNHVEMGEGVILGGHSALIKSTDVPGAYLGFPAEPAGEWRRVVARLKKLGSFEKRLRALEK